MTRKWFRFGRNPRPSPPVKKPYGVTTFGSTSAPFPWIDFPDQGREVDLLVCRVSPPSVQVLRMDVWRQVSTRVSCVVWPRVWGLEDDREIWWYGSLETLMSLRINLVKKVVAKLVVIGVLGKERKVRRVRLWRVSVVTVPSRVLSVETSWTPSAWNVGRYVSTTTTGPVWRPDSPGGPSRRRPEVFPRTNTPSGFSVEGP